MMDALIIGCWQCTALIPGISRSGATIVGGLLRGIDHEGSAHFSFLIATPIILGATVLEVPHLLHESVPVGTFELATVAAVVAGITAYASTWFLMRYFRQHDAWALNPFAYYCAVIGAGSLLLLCLSADAAAVAWPRFGSDAAMSMAMEARTKFDIRPLSPVLGAEVVGLDLAQPLDAATRREVYDAFCRYQVLCFRDQRLSKDQQIAFTEQFGTLERHIARNRGSDNPLVHTVSNLGPDGKPSGKVGSQEWHTDKSFRPEPSLATILHAITMPPDGGDTCFADMYAAL